MPVGAGFIPARIGENKKMTEHKKLQPEIRFAGFTDDWEQCKLGNIADVRDGTHSSPIYYEEGFPLVTSKNLKENGLDLTDVSFISMEDYLEINKRSKVNYGDILLGLIGTIGNPVLVDSVGFAIKNVGLIKNSENFYKYFLIQILKSSIFENYVSQKNTGNTQKFLGLDTLRNFQFLCPSKEEQTQIGNFFKQLDDTIALHQGTLEKYQKLKISYLEKMFPKGNERYPELRFPNFTDAWEQCKLGDVVNIIMGQSPDSKNYTNNSSDHILVQGNADIKNGFVYPRVWTTQITKQGHSGDLIMSVRAPVGDIAKTEYDVVLGRGVCAIKGNEFIFQLLTKMKENDYWESLSTGSTFDSINSNDIKNAEIFIPSLEEQTQIGNFFKQLDDTIALHQREVEKYKKIKQSYLEKMFI